MKRLITTCLSVMLIFAASNLANAQTRHGKEDSVTQTVPSKTSNTPNSISPHLTPFHLVNLGYQGYFKKQGIPSHATFLSEYRQKKINAMVLVKAAIEAYMLSADMLNSPEYLHAIDAQFMTLNNSN
jgi:hypothetical protein